MYLSMLHLATVFYSVLGKTLLLYQYLLFKQVDQM